MNHGHFLLLGISAGLFVIGCAPDLTVGGTGGEGGGSASSGSGMLTPEDCTDGVDNDGDGFVDCADSNDCKAQFSCTAAAPMGWTYVYIRRPPYGTVPSVCLDGTDPMRYFEEPTPANCMPCNCQVSGNCTNSLACYVATDCSSAPASRSFSTEGQCLSLMNPATLGSCMVEGTGTAPVNTTCNATGGNVMNSNPFGKEVHVCPAMEDVLGCGNSVCVSNPKPPYDDRLCLMQSGMTTCPLGFTDEHTTYKSYTDSRACSACSCDTSQIKCSGSTTFELATDSSCTQNLDLVTSTNGCVPLGTNPTNILIQNLPNLTIPKSGCLGGAPSGAVTGMEPATICCAKL